MNILRSNKDMKELFKEMNQMVNLHYPWLYKFVRRRVFFILLSYYFIILLTLTTFNNVLLQTSGKGAPQTRQ